KNHGGRDDGTGERSSANLVDACDAREAARQKGGLAGEVGAGSHGRDMTKPGTPAQAERAGDFRHPPCRGAGLWETAPLLDGVPLLAAGHDPVAFPLQAVRAVDVAG